MHTRASWRSIAWLMASVSACGVGSANAQQSGGAMAAPEQSATANEPAPPETNVAAPVNAASGDIVVTANRRAQALQDVPMSINVATGEQLQKLQIFDAKDVQQLAPGLELTNTVGRNNTAVLRGINFDPDQGTSPAVDLYFNEIPIDAQTAFTAIYDIDQIEVLRGPQGALRGRTSPAGAITIRTRRPSLTEAQGYVQATGTEDSAYNVQSALSLPLVTDKLAIRAAMLVDGNRLNQVRNLTRGDRSRSRTESARLSLAWQPVEDLNVNLMYQYLTADNRQYPQVRGPGNPAIGNPPIAGKDRYAVSEGLSRFQNSSHLVTLDASYDLGAVTLAVVAGHQYSVINSSVESDPGNAIKNFAPAQVTRTPYKVDTAEVRLLSNNDGFFNWTIGGYYSKQTGDVQVDQPLNFIGATPGRPAPDFIVPLIGDLRVPVYTRTLAVAGSVRLAFTEKLTLEAAARYSVLKAKQFASLTIPGVGTLPPLVDYRKTNHPLTGSATLTYEFSPDLTVYAAYGRSFRAGTAGVGVPQNVSNDLAVADSERSDSYEVGFKTQMFDRRLSLDVSAFYQKFDGFISRFGDIYQDQGTNIDVTGDGVPDGVYFGAPDGVTDGTAGYNYNGDATVKGVEVTINGRPTENWDFSVSSSYVKARYDNALLPCNVLDASGTAIVVPNPAFGGVNNVSYCARNGRLSDTPDFSLTANSELRFSMGSVQPFIRGLFTYRPAVYSQNVDFRYSDRELLNLFVGLRGEGNRWDLTAFARNVLGQNKVTNTTINNSSITGTNLLGGAGVLFDSGYRSVNYTNPREFGLSASYRF